MLQIPRLDSLFCPQSVAVIGASATPGKIGHILLEGLCNNSFSGKIYPVNPKGETILGMPVIRNIAELALVSPFPEMAIICVPAALVLDYLEEIAEIGIKSAVIISSGFRDTGSQGSVLEEKAKELAAKHGLALLGPNCLGIATPRLGFNALATPHQLKSGHIGFFSQSASFCPAFFEWAQRNHFGFSSFASLGNSAVLDEADIIAHMANDPNTKVIIGFIESIKNGSRFLQCAYDATRKKPVILMKAARTNVGARASGIHTGTASGSDMAYDAAFRQAGIIRADTMIDLFSFAQSFAMQPMPKGPGIVIVTTAGGPGVIAADSCSMHHLNLTSLMPETAAQLKAKLPGYASTLNPIDVGKDATPELLETVLQIVAKDPTVHSILVIGTDVDSATGSVAAPILKKIAKENNKPSFVCLMGGDNVKTVAQAFRSHNIPCYDFPETAVRSIATMLHQHEWKESPMSVEICYRRDMGRARKVVDAAMQEGIVDLAEYRALELMRAYEMPVLETKLVRTSEEAVHAVKQLGGFPVALKIASPHITHKSDAGGVQLHINDAASLKKAFTEITANASRYRKGAYIAGCLVQAMAPHDSHEVVIGFQQDRLFGPMVTISLSGVYRDTFKDIACRLAPLSLSDAHDMIRELKFFPILTSKRFIPKFTALEDLLLIMSELALDFPEIQEAECNPVFAAANAALVGGMKVYLSPSKR